MWLDYSVWSEERLCMMKAFILAGGKGSRMWPYADVRNKAMLPVSNKPVIAHTA
jgi:NDP-sugar pyrophosphorylase family protein